MIDLSNIINLNSNVKMRLLKNKWMVIAAMLLTLSVADAVAQPSIPRRNGRSGYYGRPRRSYSSSNTVWGTQYDWLSRRYANYDDVQYRDRGQVRVLLNSIYARHGRRFKDAGLRHYFNSQSWYNPWRNEVPSSEFNRYEQYNISFLSKYD
jgi:hypothetical protein